jgi:hypothetical protein
VLFAHQIKPLLETQMVDYGCFGMITVLKSPYPKRLLFALSSKFWRKLKTKRHQTLLYAIH